MTDYTLIGRCNLGAVYSHDFSYRVVVVTDSGEVLGGADEVDGFSRFWFCDVARGLVDGDTGAAYEVH